MCRRKCSKSFINIILDFTNVSKFVKRAPQDIISFSYFKHSPRFKHPQIRLSSKNIMFQACIKQGIHLSLRTFEFSDNKREEKNLN
jgi:hypothetical protein